jgi:hypothetical protein
MLKFGLVGAASILLAGCSDSPSPEEVTKICTNYSELAGSMMGARQAGATMAMMMAKANGLSIAEGYVKDAFRIPRYSLPAEQVRAAEDFSDTKFRQCHDEF